MRVRYEENPSTLSGNLTAYSFLVADTYCKFSCRSRATAALPQHTRFECRHFCTRPTISVPSTPTAADPTPVPLSEVPVARFPLNLCGLSAAVTAAGLCGDVSAVRRGVRTQQTLVFARAHVALAAIGVPHDAYASPATFLNAALADRVAGTFVVEIRLPVQFALHCIVVDMVRHIIVDSSPPTDVSPVLPLTTASIALLSAWVVETVHSVGTV